MYQITVALTRK